MEKGKRPQWLNKRLDYASMRTMGELLRSLHLNTVCEGAKCPNMGECFRNRTATFMILGDVCTRNCRFCAIPGGRPAVVDADEPCHVAEAARRLGLKHVVITSVTRDDLPDGGATQFAKCIEEIHKVMPTTTTEVLIPDFQGDTTALDIVIAAAPDIINHNVETVPDLYSIARPMADYQRSLDVLDYVKKQNKHIFTKSGIMLGLGETQSQVLQLFDDLRHIDCDVLTIGQYLPPSHQHVALKEYITPEQFDNLKDLAMQKGFRYVASGPYVRSSYHALEAMVLLIGN